MLLAAVNDEAGHHSCREEGEEQHNHDAPAGTVAEMPFGAEQQKVAHIAQRFARRVNEIREAGVLRADEAPDDSRNDQGAYHITRPDMHSEQVILGQVCDEEGSDERPVE